jgi:hypothetical protein
MSERKGGEEKIAAHRTIPCHHCNKLSVMSVLPTLEPISDMPRVSRVKEEHTNEVPRLPRPIITHVDARYPFDP